MPSIVKNQRDSNIFQSTELYTVSIVEKNSQPAIKFCLWFLQLVKGCGWTEAECQLGLDTNKKDLYK